MLARLQGHARRSCLLPSITLPALYLNGVAGSARCFHGEKAREFTLDGSLVHHKDTFTLTHSPKGNFESPVGLKMCLWTGKKQNAWRKHANFTQKWPQSDWDLNQEAAPAPSFMFLYFLSLGIFSSLSTSTILYCQISPSYSVLMIYTFCFYVFHVSASIREEKSLRLDKLWVWTFLECARSVCKLSRHRAFRFSLRRDPMGHC